MSKLIKLTETHYIIVDDSEIREGDWIFSINGYWEGTIAQATGEVMDCWKKITHSTNFDWVEVYYIPLSEVKELIGEMDVEKNMWYERNVQNPYSSDSLLHTGFNKGFELGYNQALEDNKEKKYTEDDISYAIGLYLESKSIKEIIQSLQPKTEWEVEIIDGKLKLKQHK